MSIINHFLSVALFMFSCAILLVVIINLVMWIF